MEEAQSLAAQWAGRIARVRDPELRAAFVRHELGQVGPATALDLLAGAHAGTEAGDPRHTDLLYYLLDALIQEPLARLRRATLQYAREAQRADIVILLGRNRRGPDDGEEAAPPRTPQFSGERPLTLGERKSLARGRDRNVLARVLRDPHPDVVRIVLANPRVTEDDVVRIAARRPGRADVLRAVARHPRWNTRYRVRLALISNPRCPEEIALTIAPFLHRQDARRISANEAMPDTVRRAAEQAATRRTVH